MDVFALLNAGRSADRAANVARIALSQYTRPVECPTYFAALNRALLDEPPPFITDVYSQIYRNASAEGQWMLVSLMTNAEHEGEAAKRLWSLAANAVDRNEGELLKRHAVDESRHALAYL